MLRGIPVLSILEAVLTVSEKGEKNGGKKG